MSVSREPDLADLVVAVFRQWRVAGIAFLVLRNYEELPHDTTHDIDILILPEQLALAESLLVSTAHRVGYHLYNRAEFSPVSLFFFHDPSLHQIQFDLFTSLNWRGLAFLSPRTVLDRRVARDDFWVPHPIHEIVNNLLTRLIYHGYVKEKYKPTIVAGCRQYPDEIKLELARICGGSAAPAIMRAIAAERWTEVERHAGALRRRLVWSRFTRYPGVTLRSLLHDLGRFYRRLRYPPGLTVVFLGGDGSGKSTVASRVIQALSRSFAPEKGLRVHWKPVVFLRDRRAKRLPTTNPHGQRPRDPAVSFIFLVYHWLEFAIGVWTQFLPVRFRNGLVAIERYHFDFAVDPQRYRMQVSPHIAQRLFVTIPAPDLVFLLDAPPEVLHSRKREVTLEETRRQTAAYRELVGKLKTGRIINCAQPLDEVVAEVVREVLHYLKRRQQQCAGKRREAHRNDEQRS